MSFHWSHSPVHHKHQIPIILPCKEPKQTSFSPYRSQQSNLRLLMTGPRRPPGGADHSWLGIIHLEVSRHAEPKLDLELCSHILVQFSEDHYYSTTQNNIAQHNTAESNHYLPKGRCCGRCLPLPAHIKHQGHEPCRCQHCRNHSTCDCPCLCTNISPHRSCSSWGASKCLHLNKGR
jgi:hypothetical protein